MKTSLILLLFVTILSFVQADSDEPCVKGVEIPADFDASVWPEMWRVEDDPSDPMALNQGDAVEPQVLAMAGVQFMQMDPGNYTYPANEVPWEPAEGEAVDPALQQLRQDLNYSYADIITVTSLVDDFWEEHHHAQESIRYVLDGSGYFDMRDVNDKWIRMHVKKGGFLISPAGINHRFAIDANATIQAMRLYQGTPVWTAYPREQVKGNHTARNDYVNTYLCGIDPDLAEAGDESTTDTSSIVSSFDFVSKSALAVLVVLSLTLTLGN
jgi:1,2-dihydroxy-3-keto-5-methylthiopentene dioxygenase